MDEFALKELADKMNRIKTARDLLDSIIKDYNGYVSSNIILTKQWLEAEYRKLKSDYESSMSDLIDEVRSIAAIYEV